MKRSRSLDDLLPVVFITFALLCGATLWQEAVQPTQACHTRNA